MVVSTTILLAITNEAEIIRSLQVNDVMEFPIAPVCGTQSSSNWSMFQCAVTTLHNEGQRDKQLRTL